MIVRRHVAPRWYLAAAALPLLVVGLASVGVAVLDPGVGPSLLPGRPELVLVTGGRLGDDADEATTDDRRLTTDDRPHPGRSPSGRE